MKQQASDKTLIIVVITPRKVLVETQRLATSMERLIR